MAPCPKFYTRNMRFRGDAGISSPLMTDFSFDIDQCLSVLQKGGVILYPTDTIWGIGCDATNPAAVRRLIEIKEKPPGKGLIVLVASERDILQYSANVDLGVFEYLERTGKPT